VGDAPGTARFGATSAASFAARRFRPKNGNRIVANEKEFDEIFPPKNIRLLFEMERSGLSFI
jgi:hypothetical protein